jgi:Secretion system C-terminal sorting domain
MKKNEFYLKAFLLLVVVCNYHLIVGQTVLNGFTQKSYDNVSNTYNYTYWDANHKTNISPRKFTNHTSSYNLNMDYTNLKINSLEVNLNNSTASTAFQEANATTFPNLQAGNIHYKILQNGSVLHEKTATPTNLGIRIGQMVEYGTWLNRRVMDSLNFTNAPALYGSYSGIELSNWHNRFKITFHVKPRTAIINAQLELTVQIPDTYNQTYASTNVYGFAKSATGEGFAVKGGSTVSYWSRVGNTIVVQTTAMNLLANTPYEISLIFYAVKNNFSTTYIDATNEDANVTVTTTQTLPTTRSVPVTYATDEGLYYIDVPAYYMGYNSCNLADALQNLKLSIQNTQNTDKRVRLCFRQIPGPNIVGFSSMLRNPNGDPSGIPLQISKNWHTSYDMLYSGTWIREYTEVIVPSNSVLNIDYTRIGAKWGRIYGAFSHQLSVVGAGVSRGGWLEAGLGSFGENITHSPDYEYGNSNICDYRPFLVTNRNYGGTSTECFWTGNAGGMDLCFYNNSSGTRIYQSQVKTRFKKYGPNLTETSISAYSDDNKLKLDYTFQLNRSDDYVRVYYKIKIKALANTSFTRFDIFQLGSDNYNYRKAQSLAYGNDAGLLGQFTPNNLGTNNYTTPEIALSGTNPWIWSGDGKFTEAPGGISIETNNAIIIRSYTALLNGQVSNTPYFRERSNASAQTLKPTQYCLVPPPNLTSFAQGDSIELLLEAVCLPKQTTDYYGPNVNFTQALTQYGNTWELLYREVLGNRIAASSETNLINTNYPLTVTTINNTGLVTITGGKGYVPIVFKGLTNITDPKLWKLRNNSWELVDQTNYGKDFWQTEYDETTGLFELIYNVNQDLTNDAIASIKYYLGTTPPAIVLPVELIRFTAAPLPKTNQLTWETATERNNKGFDIQRQNELSEWLSIGFVTAKSNAAIYTYEDEMPLPISYYRLRQIDFDGKETFSNVVSVVATGHPKLKAYPNPVSHFLIVESGANKAFQILNVFGQSVLSGETTSRIDLSALPQGSYILKIGIEQVMFVKQ